ncbi:uncharacterized protein LOC115451071 isoform X2 [Manduca sexta]|nr:uncharacterized protein LOC115451071 isoform X2 [Manduca sexta]XP_037300173.1 uncharacterized protein LOC115451071 isoform X2 [Manduca sexta]
MNQVLIPLLLLATAAFSSSNVLPMLSTNHLQRQPFGLKSQNIDNIFSNRQDSRSILNSILYEIPSETPENGKLKSIMYNTIADNNQAEYYNAIIKNDKYNGKGFRKEQWHNYPRQLDRLHNYFYEPYNVDKRNLDPDDPDDNNEQNIQYRNINDITNEFRVDSDDDSHNIYDAFVATTNPLLIFKIRLACLSNNIANTDTNQYLNDYPLTLEDVANELKEENENYEKDNEEMKNLNEENPMFDVVKVKRKTSDATNDNKLGKTQLAGNKAVSKRIFSLWSRLQSLNHKGHELFHRRHLHAFYGMPDSDGSGVLTAETRATLMRPPGSPLRWG